MIDTTKRSQIDHDNADFHGNERLIFKNMFCSDFMQSYHIANLAAFIGVYHKVLFNVK